MRELQVKIAFDQQANVWVTWHSQVPGLTAIDATRDGLFDQIEKVVPELLDLSRESTRLPRDNLYDIVVFEQPPDETHPPTRFKSFSVPLDPH
jgi:hypothetical protein